MQQQGKILIVDDNRDVLNALEILLDDEFEEVKLITNPNRIVSELNSDNYDAVLLDMNFQAVQNTGNEGIYWLRKILEANPAMVVILLTAFGEVNLAVKAMKQGATDFILKPWDNEKLLATLRSAVKLSRANMENQRLKRQNAALVEELKQGEFKLTGRSKSFSELIGTIKKIAPTDANILITGANGTGKTLLAREIHHLSNRHQKPFITVDLGAITETLFESEMFGHKKGAFTDAHSDRTGKIEAANGGTLFLDEIGNLSLSMQSKLLTALQEKTVFPLGSNTPVKVDIRLVSATNKNPEILVKTNAFREDLFYRINTITVHVPPLCERIEDISPLAKMFLSKYRKKYQKPQLAASEDFFDALRNYPWPGNVRELEHAIEKAVIMTTSATLTENDFKSNINFNADDSPQPKTLEEIEKQAIIKALKKNNGNLVRAAKELEITRQTIYNKMKKYDL
nr:sigma-54-dependent Fis family transcriptional regulator [Bacteroidota bacterium]